MYRHVAVPEAVQGDWVRGHPNKIGHVYDQRTHPRGAYTPELIADMRRASFGLISEIDVQRGRLFGHMNEMGLSENTWLGKTRQCAGLLRSRTSLQSITPEISKKISCMNNDR